MKLTSIVLFFIILFAARAVAQEHDPVADSIVKKVYWYSLKNPSSTLFVHFDKNVYTNNENVWLTAYLLNNDIKGIHQTLSVAVIRNDDRSILAESKFPIAQSLAFGNLFLPDSLPTGNYSFICYTNQIVNGFPSAIFIQPVTIKTTNASGFITKVSLIDSIKPEMDSARVLVKSYTQDVSLVRGASVTYYIGNRVKPLKTGKLTTDNFGEAKISIPLKAITPENNVLQTEVSNGKEIKTFSIRLPVYKKEVMVKFYPEGGHLVNGTENVVGWEVVNNEGERMMVSGVLYNNNQPVQPVQTNDYGIGKFYITPQAESNYYIKLDLPGATHDTAYMLPAALAAGPVINISRALASDTLSVYLKNTIAGNKWIVMIHNYRSTFINSSITSTGKTITLKVPLQEVPKGLNTITLLDTLGRPWAERLFFAHFDKKAVIDISTDSTSYATRQKVTVKLKVTDPQQKPLKSLVSIACVQDNRLEPKKTTDIESHAYMVHELMSFPWRKNLMNSGKDNQDYLENLLLVKSWRKYTWKDLARTKATDTLPKMASLAFTGKASLKGKPQTQPLELLVVKLPAIDLLKTDSAGKFQLPDSMIVVPFDRQLQLKVNNKKQNEYTIKVHDPYRDMNKKLAGKLQFDDYNLTSFSQTSQAVVLKNEEGAKRLQDVTVTTKKDNSIFSYGANVCGDYVCMYNILNCPNHPGGSAPVVGRRYFRNTTSIAVVYQGCEALRKEQLSKLVLIEGIYTAKEFYVADYSKFNPPAAEHQSTIYWNYSLLTNDNGEAEMTFYTSDVPGKFRIVIQGITSNNVVYGEQFFEVRKP